MCGCVFMTSSSLYSYSLRDCSPSSSPQRLFNHAACVNELCLVYSCVGRTQGNRSDQINMRTLSLLSLSDLLRWFKWKSSLVFMLLQMSVNTHTHTQWKTHTQADRQWAVSSPLCQLIYSTPVLSPDCLHLHTPIIYVNVLLCSSAVWILICCVISCEKHLQWSERAQATKRIFCNLGYLILAQVSVIT